MTNQPFLFMLVRHGKTRGNDLGNYRSWSNGQDAQLDGPGRDGIRDAPLWLQSAKQTFPLIISDDLDRSIETREILKTILQIPVARTDKRLRPVNVGDFTGQSKNDFPLDKYLKNTSLKIPGGESFNEFNSRQAKFFDYISEIIQKLGKPILVVGHGSTVAFLHNAFNKSGGEVGYEGLVNPGGVLMFTSKGIEPLTQKRSESPSLFKQGTATSGFVTSELNRPPRECWNCRWFSRNVLDLGACSNPLVRIDPKLVDRHQDDGSVAVGENDCCDAFANKIGS